MHITILHYAAPPIIGGVESVIYHHAIELAALGHEVQVIAGRGEPFDLRVAFHAVDLIDSRHPDIIAIKDELDQGIVSAAFEGLVQRIEAQLAPLLRSTDVLIAHNVLSLHKNLPLTVALHRWATNLSKPRLIAWHHDLAWISARYQPDMHEGYPWELLRQVWVNTRHVAVSAARRDDVAATFGIPHEAITVIPGGVDAMDFLGIDADTAKCFRNLGVMDADPLLLLPSRITRRKNIELALRVVATLGVQHPTIKLIVTGPPGPHNPENASYYDELKALRASLGLNDRVLFLSETLGEPPDDAMMRTLYRLADAMILPSFEEGFGLPILEAGLVRLPIFCADIPALRELAGADADFFSPHAEPHSVANQIARGMSLNAGLRLHRTVLRNYDWNSIVRRYIEPILRTTG